MQKDIQEEYREEKSRAEHNAELVQFNNITVPRYIAARAVGLTKADIGSGNPPPLEALLSVEAYANHVMLVAAVYGYPISDTLKEIGSCIEIDTMCLDGRERPLPFKTNKLDVLHYLTTDKEPKSKFSLFGNDYMMVKEDAEGYLHYFSKRDIELSKYND